MTTPTAPPPAGSAGFRWAVLGTGDVAAKFALGLATAGSAAHVSRVASRTPSNAEAFAERFGATAGTYEQVLEARDVDAVYVATPPDLHAEHACAALSAGHHVLVEKPLASTVADATAIAEAARAADRFAMEAMWSRFLPATQRVRDLVREGAIGEPRFLAATFAIAEQRSSRPGGRSPASGNGAMLRRGVYPLSLASFLLGPVTRATGHVVVNGDDVDEVTAVVEHEGGASSCLHAGFTTTTSNDLEVAGTEGRIELAGPLFRSAAVRVHGFTARPPAAASDGLRSRVLASAAAHRARGLLAGRGVLAGGRRVAVPYEGNGYGHQARAVMEAIAAGRTEHPDMPLEESVHLVETMARLVGTASRTERGGDR